MIMIWARLSRAAASDPGHRGHALATATRNGSRRCRTSSSRPPASHRSNHSLSPGLNARSKTARAIERSSGVASKTAAVSQSSTNGLPMALRAPDFPATRHAPAIARFTSAAETYPGAEMTFIIALAIRAVVRSKLAWSRSPTKFIAPSLSKGPVSQELTTRVLRPAPRLAVGRLSSVVKHRIGEGGPGLRGPLVEGLIGERDEPQAGVRVDPEHRAAAAEMAVRPRRVARARPVRMLRRADLEAEPPVVRVPRAVAGQDAAQSRVLHAGGVGEGCRVQQAGRFEQLVHDASQIVHCGHAARGGASGQRRGPQAERLDERLVEVRRERHLDR